MRNTLQVKGQEPEPFTALLPRWLLTVRNLMTSTDTTAHWCLQVDYNHVMLVSGFVK